MTDYEYILQQAKLFHYKGWEDGELRKCVDNAAITCSKSARRNMGNRIRIIHERNHRGSK